MEKLKKFANPRSYTSKPNFPCEHQSEYVWEHGGNAILATIITAEMVSTTTLKSPSK